MSLEHELDTLLPSLLTEPCDKHKIIACLDLTLLDENTSLTEVKEVYATAQNYSVAAVCMYMQHITLMHAQAPLFNSATVINFPHGLSALDSCLSDIQKAQQLGIKEIDYVFPYTFYLQGEKDKALTLSQAISEACVQADLTLKIILETGAFPSMQSIFELSKELIHIGCDFLKTSTGKISKGASLSAAFAILSAINECAKPCGIKLSGGVKTTEQAFAYVNLAELMLNKRISPDWFRIGASSLLRSLIN